MLVMVTSVIGFMLQTSSNLGVFSLSVVFVLF